MKSVLTATGYASTSERDWQAVMNKSMEVETNRQRIADLCRAFNAEDFDLVATFYAPEIRGYRPEITDDGNQIKFRRFDNATYMTLLRKLRGLGSMTIVCSGKSADLISVSIVYDGDGSLGQGSFGFDTNGLIDFAFLRPVASEQVAA